VYYEDGLLNDKQLYELLGNQILDTYKIQKIVELINKEREQENQKDLFDNLERANKILKGYQTKKLDKLKSIK
jgi:hypothetical protein